MLACPGVSRPLSYEQSAQKTIRSPSAVRLESEARGNTEVSCYRACTPPVRSHEMTDPGSVGDCSIRFQSFDWSMTVLVLGSSCAPLLRTGIAQASNRPAAGEHWTFQSALKPAIDVTLTTALVFVASFGSLFIASCGWCARVASVRASVLRYLWGHPWL